MGYDVDPMRMSLDAWPSFEAHPWDTLPEIRFGSLEDTVRHGEIVFVAVQTPHAPRYEGATKVPAERIDFDYTWLCDSIRAVSVAMDAIEGERTVVVISTCLPGTIRERVVPLLHPRIRLAYSPLLIAMSQVVADYYSPEFAILGGDDDGRVEQFLGTIHAAPVRRMSIESAELTKVAYNVAISAKIVQANALMEIAEKLPGVNLEDVTGTLKLATDRIVSSKYMDGGGPDAGACHPRDLIAMSALARRLDLSFDLFGAVAECRDAQTEWLAREAATTATAMRLPIVVAGLAYKSGVSLTQGSGGRLVCSLLLDMGHAFDTFDPVVNPDTPRPTAPAVFLVMTKHPDFAALEWPAGSVVIDPHRYIPEREGVTVHRVGESL